MSASYGIPPNPNFVEVTKQFLMAMPIARHFGFDITDVAPGRFEITQPFRPELSISRGYVPGGSHWHLGRRLRQRDDAA